MVIKMLKQIMRLDQIKRMKKMVLFQINLHSKYIVNWIKCMLHPTFGAVTHFDTFVTPCLLIIKRWSWTHHAFTLFLGYWYIITNIKWQAPSHSRVDAQSPACSHYTSGSITAHSHYTLSGLPQSPDNV